jgi:hypothetical protein
MANQFNKTKIASAVAAVVFGLGLTSAANAVVVVGGDNGWEVSFDGNINAFYVMSDNDAGFNNLGLGAAPVANGQFAGTSEDISRVTSGFLPAFFSFNVKSPTVNGLTATGRFSFAPTINNSTNKTEVYAGGGLGNFGNGGIQGASIDTREVVVNVDGGFGTVSFGRTLSIFGRQATLNDMTLFGVGMANMDGAGVTAGRTGRGYTYPNFNARFSYKTPVFSGFQAEFGLYDPSVEQLNNRANTVLNQTDTPRFEGELTYATTFANGSFKAWVDGLWQDLESTIITATDDATVSAWGAGATASYMGFALTGYYYDGEGLGRSLQFVGGTACNAAGTLCEEAENDGYYVQGTYTFNGKTKVGASYGESTEDAYSASAVAGGVASGLPNQDVSLDMWTVGVYHDVNSWLKLIAEYSNSENEYSANGAGTFSGSTESDTFSLGTFFVW